MSRKVKCHITGAWGTSDTFVKIGNHYYKNQYVYDEDHRLKEERKQLIDYICKKFLQSNPSQSPPDIELLIRRNTLPIRPGRKDPRKVKTQSAVSFLYRVA